MNPLANQINIKDIRLPIQYIITGIVFFIISQIVLLKGASAIANETAQSPDIWGAAHLLLLGFAVMVAMGAMYQLVPVAMQTEIYSLKLGHWHYYSFVFGVLGMGISFIIFSTTYLLIFAAITVISIVTFQLNMWLTIKDAKTSEIKISIITSLIYFLLTITLGFWLVIDFFHPHLIVWHQKFLKLHILFGIIGWFTFLILGFSMKLLPMFTLSHGYESKLTYRAIFSVNGGIVLGVLGIIFEVTLLFWLGFLAVIIGIIFFYLQVRIILKKRLKKKLDLGVYVAIAAFPLAVVGAVLLAILSLLIDGDVSFTAIIYFLAMGWIALTILGYLFKIIPFLWWTYKYSNTIGRGKVPALKEMTNEKRGKWIMILLTVCFTLNSFAIMFNMVGLFSTVQVLLILVGIWYFVESIFVFKH
jgi:hypothetical protein